MVFAISKRIYQPMTEDSQDISLATAYSIWRNLEIVKVFIGKPTD